MKLEFLLYPGRRRLQCLLISTFCVCRGIIYTDGSLQIPSQSKSRVVFRLETVPELRGGLSLGSALKKNELAK